MPCPSPQKSTATDAPDAPEGRDCDVIIVNYNAGQLVTRCVDSALTAAASRVIVVDNASADGSAGALETAFAGDHRLTVLRNATNMGFANACNNGARTSAARHLLFLNPDSTIDRAALVRLREILESDPRIGMVGGMLCNPDGSEQRGGRRALPTPGRAFINAFGLSKLRKFFPKLSADFLLHQEPLPEQPVAVESISGACMLVKRVAIAEVGLWDEGYFLHCEDLDWCMRFRLKGWKILFVPDARVVHQKGACSTSRPFFVEWHKHKGMLRFYRKFFRRQYPGLLMWLVAVGVWLRFGVVAGYCAARRAGLWLRVGRG